MSARSPSPWRDDAAEFVQAFREDVAIDVDVDRAWEQFREAAEPRAVHRGTRRRLGITFGVAAALAASIAWVWWGPSATSYRTEAPQLGLQAPHGAASEPDGVAPSKEAGRGPAEARESAASSARTAEPAEASAAALGEAGGERSGAPESARGRERPPTPAVPASVPPPPSRLAEELRLLDAMRASATAGRHAETLRWVSEHEASFASGSFAAERELAKVRALCGLGKHEQVRRAQAEFASAHRTSHLASLVRSACPAASKEIPTLDHDQ